MMKVDFRGRGSMKELNIFTDVLTKSLLINLSSVL